MAKVTLPFGSGLDRYTGVMAVQPGSMADLVNARPLAGKVQARRGTVLRTTLPAMGGHDCSAVLLLQAVQSQQEAIAVGWYEPSREVHVFRLTGLGTDPVHVDRWFRLRTGAQTPPVVVSAESYGKVFLAHDEPHVGLRAPTHYYDGVGGTLTRLTAKLGDPRDDNLYFRGVLWWRDYLVGWGYGDTADNRPELVRISLPAEPLEFDPDHYFIVGDRGSPVVACRPAGPHLLCLKPSSTFRILGSSELDFAIVPQYALYGSLSSRLALSIEGTCFAWGFEGPWATRGGDPTDLETFLDLERPAPAELPPEGLARLAFAHYIPRDRTIEWHWGDRIYCLHLEQGGGPRWSYRTRAQQAMCGSLLYSRGAGVISDPDTVPVGAPTINSVERTGRYMTLTWANGLVTGSEVLEIWVRGGGAWHREEPDAGVTLERVQSHQFFDLLAAIGPGRDYDIAIRYRLRGRYAPEYQSEDPAQWPAKSRGTFSTLEARAPQKVRASWSREGAAPFREAVTVRWAVPFPAGDEVVTVYRRPPTPPGLSERPAEEIASGVPIGDGEYVDYTIQGETLYHYHLVSHIEDPNRAVEPSEPTEEVRVYSGPGAPTRISVQDSPIFPGWLIGWEAADASYGEIIRVDGREEIRLDPTAITSRVTRIAPIAGETGPPSFRMRSYLVTGLLPDLGEWVRWSPP